MNKKTDAEVIINGKRYCLAGYESEEYLQKVASYLNGKYALMKEQAGYRSMDVDTRTVLMQINIADDYFKLKQQLVDITDEMENKDEEIYGLKHDVVALQKKIEDLQRDLEKMKTRNVEEQKKVVKLETELSGYKKR